MRAPIHSVKHYVQMSRTPVGAGAEVGNDLVISTLIQDVNAVDEVTEGAVVKMVFIELWIEGNADASSIVSLAKLNGGVADLTFTEMVGVGLSVKKKNILFFHHGLTSNDGITRPLAIMRGWYKIPKSKQRFGLGDRLVLQVASQGTDGLDFCGFATYKEYT